MKKEQLIIKNNKGFFLIEALLSIAVFALLVTAFAGIYLYGQESTALAGNRAKAVLVAEEGLEAVFNIQDGDFSILIDGTYGLVISGDRWIFSGSSDVTGIFTREVVISAIDADRKRVASNVSWQQNLQRTGSVSLTTIFSNWQDLAGPPPVSSCSNYCIGLDYSDGTCRANLNACNNSLEIYESGGNLYCTGGNQVDTCCCIP